MDDLWFAVLEVLVGKVSESEVVLEAEAIDELLKLWYHVKESFLETTEKKTDSLNWLKWRSWLIYVKALPYIHATQKVRRERENPNFNKTNQLINKQLTAIHH